jgi:hypothetical protein
MFVKAKGLSTKLPWDYLGVFYKDSYPWHFLKKSFNFVDLEVGKELNNIGLPPFHISIHIGPM